MTRPLRHLLRVAVVLLCAALLAGSLSAQLLSLRLVTSAYSWQRQDTVGQSSAHLFGYQTAQFSLAGDHLSFHTYLQGFNDFAGPVKNKGLLRAYNFYLRYAGLFDVLDLSLGRQAIFGGVGNGTIDGGAATLRLMDSRIRVLGYYGALPAPGHRLKMIDDASDNTMFGGRITATPAEFAQVSVSYLNRSYKPQTYWTLRDSMSVTVPYEVRPNASAEQLLGGDVLLEYSTRVSGYARYSYDLNTERLDRIQLETRVAVAGPLALTGEFIHREPRLSFNSIFWVFAVNTLTEYEFGAEYAVGTLAQVYAKYGTVSYGGEDRSDRLTIGANSKYVSGVVGWSTGYAGQLKSFAVNAGYPLLNGVLTPTVGANFGLYKLSSNAPEDWAMSLAGGAVYRPSPVFSLDAQLQFLQNKVYNSDVRIFLRASYHLSERLNIF
jgi:hypothetical protein